MSSLMTKLRFTLFAWRKMCFIRDLGNTEVSFFAISRKEDLGLVVDVKMPYQKGSTAYTEFDEPKLTDFFEDMVDAGYHPEEFGRIWCHTHPGISASPSGKDEDTFKSEFSAPNWAIMFILGKGDKAETTCRIKYQNHPQLVHVLGSHVSKQLDVEIDLNADCPAINQESRDAWKAEYEERCAVQTYQYSGYQGYKGYQGYQGYQGYSGYNGHNYQSTAPNWNSQGRWWKEEVKDKVFGAGWRKNAKGRWVYSSTVYAEDVKNNITVSPDFTNPANSLGGTTPSSPTSEDWRERFRSDDEAGKSKKRSPIGFYQHETTHNGRLTKREKRYLKKHGTLKGFVPPQRKGAPKDWDQLNDEEWKKENNERFVRTEKLETSRNLLLYDQNDDDWLAEAADAYDQKNDVDEFGWYKKQWKSNTVMEPYKVTISDGTVYNRVWANCEEEAVFLVEEALGIEPSILTSKKDEDGSELDKIPEPTDEELTKLEEELAVELANEYEGLRTYSEHELSVIADNFFDSLA